MIENCSIPLNYGPGKHSCQDIRSPSFDTQSESPDRDQVSLEEAYAFIICLDPDIQIDELDNVENCRVFGNFDELRSSVAGGGQGLQAKPVIVLTSQVRADTDHLVVAVTLHWRYGGKYVLSRAKCTYSSKIGSMQVAPVSQLDVGRIAMVPCVLAMPAREAFSVQDQSPFFVPSKEFTVCIPQAPISAEEARLLEDEYAGEYRTRLQADRLAKMGGLDYSILRRLPVGLDWPLAHLITNRLERCRQLNVDLENRNFSAAKIETIIATIQVSVEDLLYIRNRLDDFLVALSRRPDILLQVEPSTLKAYIGFCRQSTCLEAIAGNLSILAGKISEIDSGSIAPLFELLASGLSPERLNGTFCFSAGLIGEDPARCIRLTESMRKFGHHTSLALMLVHLSKVKPSWLRDQKLLRSFRPLLSSPLLDTCASHVGEEIVSNIGASLKATERFRDAVLRDDRRMALQILRDPKLLTKVDFIPWMNSLRSLSFSLKGMALPVSDITGLDTADPTWKKLAAIRLYDSSVLEDMRTSGALDDRSDLNAIALSVTNNNSMLNDIILQKYDSNGVVPMTIEGKTAHEVFRSAAASTVCHTKTSGPLVSVIMSVYDPDLELLEISLDSIRDQTWKNIEVFLVDDGNVGSALTAIRELAAKYENVELIRVDVNSGPYVGRNYAVRKARGEFIAIQDADDWSHPERISTQMNYLLETPEARAVTTEHIRINRAGDVALESGFRVFGDGPMTSLFKTEVFRQIGGFAAIRTRGDLEMRARIAAYYGYQANAKIPLPMTLCYADPMTLSNSMRTKVVDHIKLFHENVAQMPDMTSLFRDGIPLTSEHQTPVPLMLRAPLEKLS